MTPLVLLHGFLGCAEDWREITAQLSAGRPCITLDLPGHGALPQRVAPDASFFDVVALVKEQLDALGLERFDLLGYSMGGRVALGLLLEYPASVRRAIAVGASPGLSDEAERRVRVALDEQRARDLETEPFEAWLRAWYDMPLFRTLRTRADFKALLTRRLTGRPKALAAVLRAMSPGRQPPLRKRLKACPRPLLLLAGAEDERYLALGRELAGASAAIETSSIAAAGHAPHLEQPQAFAAAVAAFLQRPGLERP